MIDPAKRLLLSCTLGPERIDADTRRQLAAGIADWDELTALALKHLAIPFLHRDLPTLGSAVPMKARSAIQTELRTSTLRNLRLAAAIRRLQRDWFEPQSIRFAAVKGVTLAQRYYGGLAERPCRDLDLLVEPKAVAATLSWLCGAGFTPIEQYSLPADPREWPRHISAMADLSREITLRTPEGDLFDLHSNLDLSGSDFPTKRLLGRTEQVAVFGVDVPVLSTSDLLVYVCYHHSRHNWTKLHWVADLVRIVDHPSFDLEQVRATARTSGMEKLLQSCLDMRGILLEAVAGTMPTGNSHAARMARECLSSLDAGSETPLIFYHRNIADRRYRWKRWLEMSAEEWRQREGLVRKVRALFRTSTPSWDMYRKLPLPRGLRWLYVPLRTGTQIVAHSPLRLLRSLRRR